MKKESREMFTEKMLSEYAVDEETDKKHRVWTFLKGLVWMPFTREKQLQLQNVTEEDVSKYQPEWEEMQKQKKK